MNRRLRPTLCTLLLMVAIARCAANAAHAEDPAPATDDAVKTKLATIEPRVMQVYEKEGRKAAIALWRAEIEKIIAEYPIRPEPIENLAEVAFSVPDSEARALFTRIANSPVATEKTREWMREQLQRLDLVGKPLELKFTALDGRQVDLAALKGKVVLIDFWATWCGPCMHDLPDFRALVNRFKDRGVAVIGISLDGAESKEKLTQTIEREGIFWPQYFDNAGRKNVLAQRLHVSSIPAVWLVDQQGILRDTYARDDTAQKIEALLATAPPAR